MRTRKRLPCPRKLLERELEDAPGGSRIVMEGVHSVTGIEVVAVGYKYSNNKISLYVSTPNAGSSLPGLPYEMKFSDE